jgi:hypothetical protein
MPHQLFSRWGIVLKKSASIAEYRGATEAVVTGLGKPETDPPREDGGGHRMSTAIMTQNGSQGSTQFKVLMRFIPIGSKTGINLQIHSQFRCIAHQLSHLVSY